LTAALPLPPLAGAILRAVDGDRSLAGIRGALLGRGVAEAAFEAAWRETTRILETANRLLLRPPA
ncbi:hypothetical protein, partial [Staphylococcus aureus]